MGRGRVKTILLTLLVICSFLFAAQNWFGEGLWPQGHTPFVGTGFFSFIGNLFDGGNEQVPLSAYQTLTDPEWIVANRQGSQKELYNTADPSYAELNGLGKEMLSALFTGIRTAAPLDDGVEDYRSMLRTQSLCLHYRTPMPVSLLCRVLSLPDAALDNIQVVEELLFLPSESSANACTLAVLDAKNGNAMTFDFPFAPDRLKGAIERNTHADSYLTYAFEINLGQEETTVPLAPTTAISLEPIETPILSASSVTGSLGDAVLPLFGYNPHTPKRYTEADDSQVFLDRKSQLRLGSDGVISFESDSDIQGLELTESIETHALLQALLNLAESIDHAAFDGNNEAQLVITSDLTDLSTVTMDYVCAGRPIRMGEGSAVEAKLVAGRLVSYRQQLRNYQTTAEYASAPAVLNAIDTLLENATSAQMTKPISLRLVYRDTKDQTNLVALWEVQ